MFAMGIMLCLIGYGLIWTGVERFRGDKVSLMGAFGLPGGTVTEIDPGGATGPKHGAENTIVGWLKRRAEGVALGGPGGAIGRWVWKHIT